jgi:hypothetical protein
MWQQVDNHRRGLGQDTYRRGQGQEAYRKNNKSSEDMHNRYQVEALTILLEVPPLLS